MTPAPVHCGLEKWLVAQRDKARDGAEDRKADAIDDLLDDLRQFRGTACTRCPSLADLLDQLIDAAADTGATGVNTLAIRALIIARFVGES